MTGLRRLILCFLLAVAGCDRQSPSQDAPTGPDEGEAPVVAIEEKAAPHPPSAQAEPVPPLEHLSQQSPMSAPATRGDKPRRVGIYTPSPGSAERVALMNALRDAVRHDIGGDPVFVVRDLRSNGDWAFGVMEPTWSGGRRIVPQETPLYRRSADQDGLDGLRTEAIWRQERGRWRVYAHSIGATDVWWSDFCSHVPFGLLTGCQR